MRKPRITKYYDTIEPTPIAHVHSRYEPTPMPYLIYGRYVTETDECVRKWRVYLDNTIEEINLNEKA